MKTINMFLTKKGEVVHDQMDAILDDVQFELKDVTSDFKRPFGHPYTRPVDVENVINTLRWLYENKSRPELVEYIKQITTN